MADAGIWSTLGYGRCWDMADAGIGDMADAGIWDVADARIWDIVDVGTGALPTPGFGRRCDIDDAEIWDMADSRILDMAEAVNKICDTSVWPTLVLVIWPTLGFWRRSGMADDNIQVGRVCQSEVMGEI